MHARFPRFWDYALAMLVAGACFVPSLIAAGPAQAVPEVDGSMVTAGLGLAAAGVLVIRSRRKRN